MNLKDLFFPLVVGICAGFASAGVFDFQLAATLTPDLGSLGLFFDYTLPGLFFGVAVSVLFWSTQSSLNAPAIKKTFSIIVLCALSYAISFWITWGISYFTLIFQLGAGVGGFVGTFFMMQRLKGMATIAPTYKTIFLVSICGGILGAILINNLAGLYVSSLIFFIGWQSIMCAIIAYVLFPIKKEMPAQPAIPTIPTSTAILFIFLTTSILLHGYVQTTYAKVFTNSFGQTLPYTTDDKYVYYQGRVISGADPVTFSVGLTGTKDKKHVYQNGIPFPEADPVTFSYITEKDGVHTPYAKDKNNVYFFSFDDSANALQPQIIPDADPSSFMLLSGFSPYEPMYAKDKNNIYSGAAIVPDVDPTTFVLISDLQGNSSTIRSKDRNHVYYGASILPDADPETFIQIFGPGSGLYAKDANLVYYGSAVVPDADVETFVLGENYNRSKVLGRDAADKNHEYREGKITGEGQLPPPTQQRWTW